MYRRKSDSGRKQSRNSTCRPPPPARSHPMQSLALPQIARSSIFSYSFFPSFEPCSLRFGPDFAAKFQLLTSVYLRVDFETTGLRTIGGGFVLVCLNQVLELEVQPDLHPLHVVHTRDVLK